MLKQLKLTNFRSHRDLTVNFTEGLQLLRGDSEKGKTTIIEGILYAWFGSRVLRSKLESVVTLGEKENSLKAELMFVHDGVDYKISRGKSGAELTFAGNTVTGQSETRAYLERLFGCTADVAANIMFASQKDVRGILDEGPTAAAGLVEKLANLGVIETLIEKITATLPSGNTRTIQVQLTNAREQLNQLAEPGEFDDTEFIAQTEQKLLWLNALDGAEADAAALDLRAANKVLQAAESARAVIASNAQQRTRWQAVLARPVPTANYTPTQLDELQRRNTLEAQNAKLWEIYNKAPSLPTTEKPEALQQHIKTLTADLQSVQQEVNAATQEIAVQDACRVTQTACGFCEKDLSNVPEVVEKNAAIDAKVAQLMAQVVKLEERRIGLKANLEQVQKTSEELQAWLVAHSAHWEATEQGAVWKGEIPTPPQATEAVNIAAERKLIEQVTSAQLQHEQAASAIAGLVDPTIPDTTQAQAVLQQYSNLQVSIVEMKNRIKEVDSILTRIERDKLSHAHRKETYAMQKKAFEEQVTNWENLLRQSDFHNDLIKKLRASRQNIASQLWNSILDVVSLQFTQVRGTPSRVERGDSGFLVNGQAVNDLSGSTIDMLGLAIRLSLSRIFLPNLSFILLDEVFAGCSENRELAGLGILASSEIGQVLLVTHSDLGDSLADNLIQL